MMSKTSYAKSAFTSLHKRFDEICLEIEAYSRNEDEQLLRDLVDERRFIHSSLIEYQSKPEVTSKTYKQSEKFLEAWSKRVFAIGQDEPLSKYLSDPEFCHVYLDCIIPLIWNWDRDWLVLVKPSDEMIVAAALDRRQRYILIYDPLPEEKEYDVFESDTLMVAKTLDEIKAFLNKHKYPIMRVQGVFCGTHRVLDTEKQEINEILRKSVTKQRLNMNTAKILTREWVENFIGNSHIIASLPHISEASFNGTDTAVLVAPGPSLNKNIHLLKELDGKALIVSVLHALPRLVKENIRPDVVIHMDSKPDQELVDHLISSMDFEIPLLIVSSNLPRHYQNIPHTDIVWTEVSANVHFELCKFLDIQFPHLSGGNVSLYAFNLCAAWGIKNIVLVGQDLSYKGEQYYADSEGLETAIDVKSTRVNTEAVEVEGYFGGVVKTSNDFSLFIDQFTQWAQTDLHKESRVINCTEGGAKIPGFEQMPLSEIIQITKKKAGCIELILDFDGDKEVHFKRLFKEYLNHYLSETKHFLEHANVCSKIARTKSPSQKQVEKRKLSEDQLKRMSNENRILDVYLTRLATDTNDGNAGIINTVSSEEFYTKLCREVIRFRSLIVNSLANFS